MRILNIGCGKQEYGTDFVDAYPQRKDVIKCDMDIDPLPYPDGTFDKVYSRYVFEHVTNHGRFLEEVKRVLKDGGECEIITDNAIFIGYILTEHGNYMIPVDGTDGHYALFTEGHLKNFAAKYGFEVQKIYYTGSEVSNHPLKVLAKKIINLVNRKITANNVAIVMKKPRKGG